MITQANINEDLRMVSENLSDTSQQLVKPIHALKLSFFFPVSIVVGYLIALIIVKIQYVPYMNSFGDVVTFNDAMSAELATNGFALLFSVIMGFALYGPALAYLTVPEKVRDGSIIISSLRRTCKKTVVFMIVLNWLVSLLGVMVSTVFLCAAPAMLLMSLFITQMVINAEVARYGFSAVLDKLNKLAKKI